MNWAWDDMYATIPIFYDFDDRYNYEDIENHLEDFLSVFMLDLSWIEKFILEQII